MPAIADVSESVASLRRIAATARRLDTSGVRMDPAAEPERAAVQEVALGLLGDARRFGGDRTAFRQAAASPEFERASLRGAVAQLRASAAVQVAADAGRTITPEAVVGADERRMLSRSARAMTGLANVLDSLPGARPVRLRPGQVLADRTRLLVDHLDDTRDVVAGLVATAAGGRSPIGEADARRLSDLLSDTRTHLRRAGAAWDRTDERVRNLAIAHGYARTSARVANELATPAGAARAGALDLQAIPTAETLGRLDEQQLQWLTDDFVHLSQLSTDAHMDEGTITDARHVVANARTTFSDIERATGDPAAARVRAQLEELDGRLVESKSGLAARTGGQATATAQPARVARLQGTIALWNDLARAVRTDAPDAI